MNTLERTIGEIASELTETRRHLHQNPELSGQEAGTARLVAGRLAGLGLDVRTGVGGGHGIIADLHGAHPGRTLALRADMDALPMTEQNDVPYRSQNTGVMHACGHDGHTTVLLGVAQVLAARRAEIAGRVRFLFQPAEETGSGARGMCEGGAMDGVDAAAALHAWPALPVGQVGLRLGAMTASADTFEIVIRGRGAHAAYPHLAVDPVVVTAQVILALQTLVSREIEPTEPAVVSITQVAAGTAPNIIPEVVRLAGTVRTHSNGVRDLIPERMRRVVDGVCAAGRARGEVVFAEGTPPVVNDAALAAVLADAAALELGSENVITLPQASMGAEDFAEYLAYVPGVFFRLGLGNPTPLHSPVFNFPDAAIPVGVRALSAFALRFLTGAVPRP